MCKDSSREGLARWLKAEAGEAPPVDRVQAEAAHVRKVRAEPVTVRQPGGSITLHPDSRLTVTPEEGVEREVCCLSNAVTILKIAAGSRIASVDPGQQGEEPLFSNWEDEADYWRARARRVEGLLRQISNLVVAGDKRTRRAVELLRGWKERHKEKKEDDKAD